jgi:hypothetical protein
MDEQPKGVDDLEPITFMLEKFGRTDLSFRILETFAKHAEHFPQYDNISKCYFKLKNYIEAIKYGEKALVVAPSPQHTYITRNNLINVYNHANLPEKALTYIKCNERIMPQDVEVQLEKAYSLYLLNRKPEAEEILHKALESKDIPEETRIKINFNLGTYYLYRDKFQEGLRHFILDGAKMKLWNTETIFNRNQDLDLPFWQGSPDVKHLIVYAEAGIGDEIINIRFMKHLKERGITPYWYAKWHGKATNDERKGLTELFQNNGFTVINDLTEVKKIPGVQWTYSMHLPIYLDLQYEDLWYGPYLKADDKFVEKWAKKLDDYAWDYLTYHSGFNPLPEELPKRLKIGIRWQGNPAYDHDLHRSYPVKQLYEAIVNDDWKKGLYRGDKNNYYYSLQRDHGLIELQDFPGISDLSGDLETIEDLFGALANLDVVITSCTSIAHAAASMGKKVIIMVPISAYYVWSHSGDQSPWYGDNVTLLRQERPRVWDEPIAKLKEILNG